MGKKEFLKEIVDGMTKLISDKDVRDKNINLITSKINGMSALEMDQFVTDLENGTIVVPVIIPNGSNGIDYENNMNLISKEKLSLHKRIIITKNGKSVMSPIPRLVMELPLKKPIQLLDKKRSIAENQNATNELTGQVTGSSKSVSITSPEIPLMMANGMNKAIKELTKYRGGDKNAEVVLEKLADLGLDITQETLERYSSGPEVNNTLKQFLRSMHLDATVK